MKKIFFAIAAVAMLFATSCSKDNNAPRDITLGEGEFLATIDNGANPQNAPRVSDGMTTKTTINDQNYVIWTTGDIIYINGKSYTTTEGETTAVFAPSVQGQGATGSTFHAFYAVENPSATAAEATLPATQIYQGNVSNLPMYATCSGSDRVLTFHNICAALKVTIPSFLEGATSIVVSSNQRMNGDFTIGENNAAVVGEPSTDADKKVTIAKSSGTFTEGEVVYIAVPAQGYSDFKVEFLDGVNTMWTKSLDSCTLNVNTVNTINLTPMELCFTYAEQSKTNCTVTLTKYGSPDPVTLETCTYNSSTQEYTDWTSYTVGTGIVLNNVGDKVYFRAGANGNTTFAKGSSNYHKFTATDNVEVSGNIMTLLSQTPSTTFPSGSTYTFCALFHKMQTLKSAENLVLPAATLVDKCYYQMFLQCSGMTKAPTLPATTMAELCYYQMFNYCSGLTKAPALPATNLAYNCYGRMFGSCKGLTTAPVLPATTLATNCYFEMFQYCTGLTTAPTLPATSLEAYCYSCMFLGCSGLTAAPTLSATTMAESCYESMFSECTSLTAAPVLPATTLAKCCYKSMFAQCTNLTTAPVLPVTTLAEECYSCMFLSCENLITAPVLPATTLVKCCYESMFQECSNLASVTMKATDVSAQFCLNSFLFYAGTSEGTHILYVDSSMTSNQTIDQEKGDFTIQAYNPPQ